MFRSIVTRTAIAALAAGSMLSPIAASAAGDSVDPPRQNSYPLSETAQHVRESSAPTTYPLSETAQRVRENAQRADTPIAGPSFEYSEAAARTSLEADAMTRPPVVRTVTVSDDDFDWTSAAIGGGIALVVVLASGGLAVSSRRTRTAHA